MSKNVNVYTKITTSHQLAPAINYITRNEPHDSDNGRINNRVLAVRALNCSLDKKTALAEFKKLEEITGNSTNKRTTACIREIKSFDNLNYQNFRDRNIALNLNEEMMQAEHPDEMSYSILQSDGKGHHLHVHNIIIPINLKTGKSTTHTEDSWYRAVHISNQVMKDNHYTVQYNANPEIKHTKNGKRYYKYYGSRQTKPKYNQMVKNFQQGLWQAFTQGNNLDDVENILNLQMIPMKLDCLRHQTINGKKVTKEYKTQGTHPELAIELPDGNYGRFRRTWLISDNYNHKIRTSKLGDDYSAEHLLHLMKIPASVLEKRAKTRRKRDAHRKRTDPVLYYNSHTDHQGRVQDLNHWYQDKHSPKEARSIIRQRYPHYPTFVPTKRPKPARPDISTRGAMLKLQHALAMGSKKEQQVVARQDAIADALNNYRKEMRDKALEYASYQDAVAYTKELNKETYARYRTLVKDTQQAEQTESHIDFGNGFNFNQPNGPTW